MISSVNKCLLLGSVSKELLLEWVCGKWLFSDSSNELFGEPFVDIPSEFFGRFGN